MRTCCAPIRTNLDPDPAESNKEIGSGHIKSRALKERKWIEPGLCDEAQDQFDGYEHLENKRGMVCWLRSVEPYEEPRGVVLIFGET